MHNAYGDDLCNIYQSLCILNKWLVLWSWFLQADGDQGDTNSAGKTAKKIYDKKFAELSGNDIFKGDAPPSSADKSLSGAKLREMSGSNIFADGKVEARDYLGGVRKPPGGESSIALV